jgi:hypothetical protein
MRLNQVLLLGLALAGCAGPALRITTNTNLRNYVRDRAGGDPSSDPASLRFRPGLCESEDLRPEYARLDESSLVRFLDRQKIDARIERPRADLLYLNLGSVGTERPVRLRVAILGSADEAGQELHTAILQHGPGSWGVHRSNLAILGPVGSISDDITFAAMTKLACWGVFTIANTDDTFVVPGAYTEL